MRINYNTQRYIYFKENNNQKDSNNNYLQNNFLTNNFINFNRNNLNLKKVINSQKIKDFSIFATIISSLTALINSIGRGSILNKYFEKLRDDFSKNLEINAINVEKSAWDFYINSNPENMQKYETAQNNYSNLFKDEATYKKFLEVDESKLSKREKKQLKDLKKEFDDELNTGEDIKILRQKENEIAQKFNSYIPMIDGKEVSKAEIVKILQTETNPEIRKKAYEAKVKCGDLIAEDLVEFVRLRNDYARKKGYDNYFDYKLKEDYDVDSEFLNKLIDDVYSKSNDKIISIQDKKEKELKEFFNVDKLESYHYGLLLDSNPEKGVNIILSGINPTSPHDEKGVNEILEGTNLSSPPDEKGVNEILEGESPTSPHDIISISKKMYKNMGYDVDKMIADGKLTLDLYPRKGKNTHGFCFGVQAGKDSRILANLTNNVTSLETLNHEMGHCVYDLGISDKLTFMDKTPASSAFTEAIAMMMGDIIKKENVLSDIVPKDLLENFKSTHKEDEAAFVSKSLLIIEFEREMYKNPDQDLALLWKNLSKKYLNRDIEKNNEWATIPHYLSHPAYYQNYFRANIMKAQIYNYLTSELGNLTENKNSAKFMDKHIFAYGAKYDEYELIKKLTGKEFSIDDFVKNLD